MISLTFVASIPLKYPSEELVLSNKLKADLIANTSLKVHKNSKFPFMQFIFDLSVFINDDPVAKSCKLAIFVYDTILVLFIGNYRLQFLFQESSSSFSRGVSR